jgi:hypothetical protein
MCACQKTTGCPVAATIPIAPSINLHRSLHVRYSLQKALLEHTFASQTILCAPSIRLCPGREMLQRPQDATVPAIIAAGTVVFNVYA